VWLILPDAVVGCRGLLAFAAKRAAGAARQQLHGTFAGDRSYLGSTASTKALVF